MPDGADHAVDIRLSGPAQNFQLRADTIAGVPRRDLPDRLLDLLEIATYVFAADGQIRRTDPRRRDWGARWRRDLHFRIAVREPEFWNRPAVRSALTRLLGFLSEDDCTFEFFRTRSITPAQAYLPFVPRTESGISVDDVILFSGGLDSLAGAIETLATTGRRVALVTHRSAQKVLPYQERLADELRVRFPGRVVPVRVLATRKAWGRARESTQRSRTFLYAALGFVVARMFGASRLRFFENGVVSINLPISEQVVGAMATRTTHPQSLRLIRNLLSLVADDAVDLANPFIWNTKAEVVETACHHGGRELIRQSVSCSDVQQRSKLHTHCGRCSQCLDRRFGTLAAGARDDDPEEMYEVDLLRGERETTQDRVMALDYVRHHLKLADISDQAFLAEHAGELTRVVEGFPEEPADAIAQHSMSLLRRQGRTVQRVLEEAVADDKSALVRGELPEASLLRLHLAGGKWADTPRPPAPASSSPAPASGTPVLPLRVMLGARPGEGRIAGVTDLTARGTALVRALRTQRDASVKEGRRPDRYIRREVLEADLNLDEVAIRQSIKRTRDAVSEVLTALGETGPFDRVLIETGSGGGYRLNPSVRIYDEANPASMSRHGAKA